MNLLSRTAIKTFSLLSIGQRGVGKTVFLAGSYVELHTDSPTLLSDQLWFDCQDIQVQENIESILSYIVRTGQYPPPTMKVTNYNFSLKRHNLKGAQQTLCHFRWLDIPGEICNIHNLDFQKMVSSSHGCCVFIDAYRLVHDNAYLQVLKDIITQVGAIANLVSLNRLNYAFVLILTKCDLLEPGSLSQQQIEERLQPLNTRLDAARVNYQTFYSFIPIVHTQGASTLEPKGAATPLLWLVWEVSKAHNPGLMNNLLDLITHLQPINVQPQQKGVVDGSLQRLRRPTNKALEVKKILGLNLLSTPRRKLLLLALAIVGFMVVIGLLSVKNKWILQDESENLDALSNPPILEQRGQLDQAISLTEKLLQQKPERLELRLQLAQLYELTGQVPKAETAYDQVLAQQKNNLKALVGKALLRNAQGDTETAKSLFVQAEKAAPINLKAQVRAVAQKALQEPAKMMPSAK